jgi:M6 family metalloprotease-like protein/uncharacterized repeat protein (TIGR02543 family)
MKRVQLSLVCLMLFCWCSTVWAVPADPEAKIVTQPDGTQVKIQIKGDEFQGWHELAGTGYTVLPNQKTGYWEYADQNPDGTLTKSGIRAEHDGKNAPSFVKKGIKPVRNHGNEGLMHTMLQGIQVQRQSALLSTGLSTGSNGPQLAWSPVPVSGAKNLLIILVNFANRSLSTTTTGWYNKVFNLADKSVAKFYEDNSFRALSVIPVSHTQSVVTPGVISVTVADNHPNSGSAFNYGTESTIINHALAQAATYLDFASYDTDGNGVIDPSELNIYFVYAGYEAAGSTLTPNIWAHAWGGTGVSVAGKSVAHWALNGELNNSSVQHPMGVIAHELGHSMCGLPDLYDTTYVNAGMGNFSPMAGGSWGVDASSGEYYGGLTPVSLDAWSREYLGWTAPLEPTSPSTVTLGAALSGSDAAYRFINRSVSTTEYFLMENRRPTGWDLGLTGLLGTSWPGGMLITHVDSSVGTVAANNINTFSVAGHQGVVPEQASIALCNMLSSTCRGDSTTLFYYGNNSAWCPYTVPTTNYYNGVSSAIYLNNISAPGSVMTGAYSSAAPPGYTISGTVHFGSLTGPGVSGATISMAGVTVITTATGSFTLLGIPVGTYLLTISAPGYTTYTDSAYVVTGDQNGVDFQFFPTAVILSESFDTVTPSALPGGWLSTSTGIGTWSSNAGTVHPTGGGTHSGSNLVFFNSFSVGSGNAATLVSPSFSLSGLTGGQVKFWMYRDAGYFISTDRVEVYVGASASISGASLLGTIDRSLYMTPVVATAGWYEYRFDIPAALNGDTNYLLLNGISMYGNDIHLDDISVSATATAAPVITGITPTSIVMGVESSVIINGINLMNAAVSFSRGSVGTATSNSSSQIVLPLTATTSGGGIVSVTTADGSAKFPLKVTSGMVHAVTFNSNGGSGVASQSVLDGSSASLPTPPTMTGYTFAGWYADSSLTTPFTFATLITADVTLYAKWTINSYTVTFNSNGGSAVISQSVFYNAQATMPAPPTRSGYLFGGWFSDAALITPFVFTTPITANITLYAAWTLPPDYTISGTIHAGSLTGPGVAGATVAMAGVNVTTTATGSFTLSGIPAGTYPLTILAPGYATCTDAAHVVVGNQTSVDFRLLATTVILLENFDAVAPPTLPGSWLLSTAIGSGTWKSNAGTLHPAGGGTHSGSNLVFFNSFTAPSGNAATLVSPSFSLTGFASGQVKFWMYRDAGYPAAADRIDVYVNTTGALSGATLLGTINRSTILPPVVATAGWYAYSFDIPAAFNSVPTYLVLTGVSVYGNDMYLDDISVSGPPVLIPTITAISPTSIILGVETGVTITGINLMNAVVTFSNGSVGSTTSNSSSQIVLPLTGTILGDGNVTVTTADGNAKIPLKVNSGVIHAVTFNSNGGSAVGSQSVPDGSSAIQPAPPTMTGYTFGGWFSDEALTTAFVFTTPITADIALYAKWTINSYAVTFNSNGGSVVPVQIVNYNAMATIPTPPTKTGYTFGGWFSDAALTTAFVLTTPITAETTLHAKWTINNYTVTFNSNGGSLVPSQSVAYNASVATPIAPTETGYTFIGWFSDTALTVAFVYTTPITVDITLYAKWTINSYPLTVTLVGGGTVSGSTTGTPATLSFSASGSSSVSYGAVVTLLPGRVGFVFTGWSGACNGMGNPVDNSCILTMTAAANVSATFVPAPTISSFTPASGTVGTTVTITGSNLSSATSVTFNGVAASVVTLTSATSLTATVPAGATSGSISVTTAGGKVTSIGSYTVIYLLPTVTVLAPTSGIVGAAVSLTGTNLTTATSVAFNGVPVTAFTVVSATQLTTMVPAGASTGKVTVTTLGGTANSSGTFTVIGPPTITSFTPVSGLVGSKVTLTGTTLGGATSVKFNGVAATTVTLTSATSLSATVPVGATTGIISVTTAAGTGTSTGVYTVTLPVPTVTVLAPTSGIVGAAVTLTGTNLTTATSVAFNGVPVAAFTVVSATQLTTAVPAGASTGKITVTTLGGTATSSGTFTVIGPPTITSFTPVSGLVGSNVTLTGTNLGGATSVKFNGVAATVVTLTSATSLSATVPVGATTGIISVTTAAGTGTSTGVYTVTLPVPTVTVLAPASGIVRAAVTLTGTNLTTATAVAFNGVPVAAFTVVSATQLTTTVPAGASTGKVTVTTLGGTATSSGIFTVIGPPTITSFTPVSGLVGSKVTLTGTNLGGATSVKFNGVAATAVTLTSATSLSVTVPVGATTGPISVTTAAGTGTSVTAYTVTIPLPTVTTLTPATGGVGAGVTLSGTNFTGATQLLFVGATGTVPVSAPFTVISATSILTAVPAGATTGKISVTTPGGTVTSTGSFTVGTTAVLPVISSFTPTSGAVGTVITVTGTNLAGVTAATVGGAGSVVKVLSVTSLSIIVPAGAGTGKLSVTTAGGTGNSTSMFTVI